MKKNVCTLLLLVIFSFLNSYAQDTLFLEQDVTSWPSLSTEKRIIYQVEGRKIGFLYYLKVIPYVYIIHSFYIVPELRNQGYGTKLLLHACDEIKKEQGNKIFIQPGPFELDDSIMSESERALRLQGLIKFYKNAGFDFTNQWIASGAKLLYYMTGIDEDSGCLMEK